MVASFVILGTGSFPGLARAQDSDKLTLRQAVTLALQNSREIALARMQYTVALNAAGVDRADFRPNLYTGSGAAYTSGFPVNCRRPGSSHLQPVLHAVGF